MLEGSLQIAQELLDKIAGWGHDLALMLPNIAVAVLVVVGFWFFGLFVSKGVVRAVKRLGDRDALAEFCGKVSRIALLVVGMLLALEVLGLDKAVTTFLAGAGVVGIALGFAFQDIGANFLSGVGMAVGRPIDKGDIIKTNDYFGQVEHVYMRSLLLRQFDGTLVRIPNRKVYQEALVNYTLNRERRVDVEVGVAYDTDLEFALQTCQNAMNEMAVNTTRDPEVFLTEFGGSSIGIICRAWIRYERQIDYVKARSELVLNIKKHFDEVGIEIPFPIRTLAVGKSMQSLADNVASVAKQSATHGGKGELSNHNSEVSN